MPPFPLAHVSLGQGGVKPFRIRAAIWPASSANRAADGGRRRKRSVGNSNGPVPKTGCASHFAAKAKRVIFSLAMAGGPSHLETFELQKPETSDDLSMASQLPESLHQRPRPDPQLQRQSVEVQGI